jgi:hypothetical protein
MAKGSGVPVYIRKNAGRYVQGTAGGVGHVNADQPRVSGRFEPGQSGNLNGRPAGSRNLTYRHLHELMMAQGEAVVTAVLAAALDGDSTAQRLVLDRILPRRVCNPIRDFTLSPLRTAADAALALGEITAAVLDGRITADEAAALASIVEVFIKVTASHEFERRLVEIEQRPRAQQ